MEYERVVLVMHSIFVLLDLIIFFKSINGPIRKNIFSLFALTVLLQQIFGIMTRLSKPIFNTIGNWFVYVAYCGALIFAAAASYYSYRYFREVIYVEYKKSFFKELFFVFPVILITVTCLISPITGWVFYVDPEGVYQRGSLFILQIICPYIYIVFISSMGLRISQKNKTDLIRLKKMRRLFISFMIPSLVGVMIQMFIVEGGFSAIGVSIGLLIMYLEIYLESINESKRLKSIEQLNNKLQQVNESQAEQLHEITMLNNMLENRTSVIQSMNRVYFVSFYANLIDNSFQEISNTDFVRKYVGTNGTATDALNLFCSYMIQPQFIDEAKKFVDLSTINERMKNKDFITFDYLGNVAGWCQLYFIAGDRDSEGNMKSIFLAARTIHDEKEREFAQNRALDNARIEAENANAAKTIFLNNMSHDIRTPLNAILGFSDLLSKNKYDTELFDNYIAKIKKSGEYLLSIINNVLDMAKIESGNVSVENSFMDLVQEAENTRSYLSLMVESSNHKFTMDNNFIHRYILIDAHKHQEIMMNLISNAIKYTPEGGSIHLQVDELPSERSGFGKYQMTVSDTGIGMSEEFLEHIFDSFARERNTTDSKIIGTGLGMSIVKRLVDILGGTIEVKSEKGKGSDFIVTCEFEIVNNPEDYLEKTDAKSISIASIEGKRILLTEDNELNAEISKTVLENYGALVEHAANGVICLEMFNNAPNGYYNLILMDIQMPILDGYSTAKRIRETNKDIPIIAVTANAFEEDKNKAIEAGMNGHLAKPIDVQLLLEKLAFILK